ncbi:MAG: hypothetical protein LBO20_07530, partial [Bifidobacteriaceae bacterium]|nr:hypothetical protein [Bifidobacteriaceae bacterium]
MASRLAAAASVVAVVAAGLAAGPANRAGAAVEPHAVPGVAGSTKVIGGPNFTLPYNYWKSHDWYAWAASDSETVWANVQGLLNVDGTTGKTPRVVVTLFKPDGDEADSQTAVGDGGGANVSASGQAGLWRVHFEGVSQAALADGQWYFFYDVGVNGSGGEVTGRVFATKFYSAQDRVPGSHVTNDFGYHTVAEDGTVHRVWFEDYQGIDSHVSADGLGLHKIDGCVPVG